MGDPQWRVSELQSESGGMSIDLSPGNLFCGYFHDERSGDFSGQLAVVDAGSDEALELNEGKDICEADATGVALACYPPTSKEVIVEVSSSLGLYDLPMTVEEEEQGICLIGSTSPQTFSAPPDKTGNVVPERENDSAALVLQADPDAEDPGSEETVFETTAENLLKFTLRQRTNLPGALKDTGDVIKQLREFGFSTFRVITAKTKQFPGGRKYLIFNGNPRAPGSFIARRELIRSFGRYTFQNPNVMELGFGARNALRSGARATVVFFIVVAAVDVMVELFEDEPSMAAAGVTIAVDGAKLAASMLAGALASGAIIAAGGPVILVAGAALVVGLVVGIVLDKLDDHFGVTHYLRERAKEVEKDLERSFSNFLYQLEWCILHQRQCFGGF